MKRMGSNEAAWGLNFCRIFLSGISLLFDLASSNLVQTLLNLSQAQLQ